VTILCAGALAPALSSDFDASAPPAARPGLAAPVFEASPCPAFLRFLGKADRPVTTQVEPLPGEPVSLESGEESWLRQTFSIAAGHTAAAAQALSLGATPGALVVRPVHLHAGRDHLVLSAPQRLELSEGESQTLFEAAVQWLAEEPITLRYLSPDLWEWVETDPKATRLGQLQVASSSRATGRNIDIWLPRGPTARTWRRLANEVQMLWHTHPVNQDREHAGRFTANSVWLEGAVPSGLAQAFERVISDHSMVSGLAQASGATLARFAAWSPPKEPPAERWLIDVPFWRDHDTSSDPAAWRGGWLAFEAWFCDMTRAFGTNWLRQAEFVLTGESCHRRFAMRGSTFGRFWRGSAAVSALHEDAMQHSS
jgi:hypothetical protein